MTGYVAQAYTMHQFWTFLHTDAYGFGNSIPLASTCMSTWRWGSLCTKLYTLLLTWLFQILQDRMLKLRIFPDEDHPFDTQPLDKFVMPPRKIREQRPRERRAAVRAQQGSSRESDWLGCRYLEGVSNKVVHNTHFLWVEIAIGKCFRNADLPVFLRVSSLTTSLPNVIVDPKQRP